MTTVVLALHLLVTAVLIFLILLQKTEGNAAGGGFGGGVSLSAMMQPRSRPNALTRATSILALTFFATSITLALLARNHRAPASIMAPAAATGGVAVPKVSDSVMETPAAPAADVPADAAPAVPAVPSVPK
ncbi:MAG: preprotein translocase subunit SecG [Proteobacteria bacterium]|nr:preprotein translocase subunit SecG [Pseudomonadota bacterium]